MEWLNKGLNKMHFELLRVAKGRLLKSTLGAKGLLYRHVMLENQKSFVMAWDCAVPADGIQT